MAKRLRIFFINCPTLATDAASFLLLAQNPVQNVLQFEVHHFWVYGMDKGNWLARKILGLQFGSRFVPKFIERWAKSSAEVNSAPTFKKAIQMEGWHSDVARTIAEYDAWLKTRRYNFDTQSDPVIIVTETPLAGGYISFTQDNIGIVGAAEWKEFFLPSSALEYILHCVQRLSTRLAFGSKMASHYPTRGCCWDFNVHQPDSRIAAFTGFICETCRTKLKGKISADEYQHLDVLVSNKWLGQTADPTSVTSLLSKLYKYDLSRSTGLNSGFTFRVLHSLAPEVGKLLVDVAKYVAIILLTIFIASKFPTVYKLLKDGPPAQEAVKTQQTEPPASSSSKAPRSQLPVQAAKPKAPGASSHVSAGSDKGAVPSTPPPID